MQPIVDYDSTPLPQEDIEFMVCPFCSHDIAAAWQGLTAHTDELGRALPQFLPQVVSIIPGKTGEVNRRVTVYVNWLLCQNTECRQVVVQITRVEQPLPSSPTGAAGNPKIESWIALPQLKDPPVLDPLITQNYAKDYIESVRILDDSPRMSSVLSRRILADLLSGYAKATQYGLAAKIEAFIADTNHPSRLRENLHYLREMGDFSAHTQTDAEQRIIDVTPEEAAWTIKIIADLFDYFIVAPSKDAKLRKAFDAKLAAANRKPIAKLPDKPEVKS